MTCPGRQYYWPGVYLPLVTTLITAITGTVGVWATRRGRWWLWAVVTLAVDIMRAASVRRGWWCFTFRYGWVCGRLELMGNEQIMKVNGVELCVETFGDREDPAILLVGGASASMDWWEEDFCQSLAGGGRWVIRYDTRDTGRSVCYPVGKPGYTELDLAADVIGLLDAFGLRSAHIAGISMGGALAQRVAVEHPDQVASLILMSTSPPGPGRPDDPQLPGAAPQLQGLFSRPAPDWTDRTAVIDHIVTAQRALAAPEYFDEAETRTRAEQIIDRTRDIAASQTNHMLAESAESVRPRLGEVTAPTLVLHGTADPLFPLAHGTALAREIPAAELLELDGVGHQTPPRALWPTVIPAILRHTRALFEPGL